MKIEQPSIHCQEHEPISIDLEGTDNSYPSPLADDLHLLIALKKET